MSVIIREALDSDKNTFIEFSLDLCRFNRGNHSEQCLNDDFEKVLESVRRNAEKTFDERDDDVFIVFAISDGRPIGYALANIFTQEDTADNGTGRMGLLDQLYVEYTIRGLGTGKRLIDEVMSWFSSRGIGRVKLHAYAWNKRARDIYEKYGFIEYVVSYEKFI